MFLLVVRRLIHAPLFVLSTAAVCLYLFGFFSLFYCRIDYTADALLEPFGIAADEIAACSFDPVERSPARLRESAFDYAELVGIRSLVEPLYEEKELEEFAEYIKRMRNLQRKKRIARSSRPSSRLNALNNKKNILRRPKDIWDPRFSLPIPRGSFWLSSPFGPRKKANGKWGFHHGIDMAANRGTPIRAAGKGRIVEACRVKGYGNTVVIQHDARFTTRYAHMQTISVSVGKIVEEGELIGTVGATGYVRKSGGDGSHLHFEVRDRGRSCNPFYFLK